MCHPISSSRVASIIALTLLTLAVSFQSALAQSLDDLFPDPVIAEGDGVKVKRGDLERAFIAYQSNLAAKGQRLTEPERKIREAQLLDRLIVTQLLINRATPEDKAKAKDLAEKNLAASKAESLSDAVFAGRLRTLGMTVEQYNIQIVEFAIAQAVVERELGSTITIDDEMIKAFYETGTDLVATDLTDQLAILAGDPNSTGNQLKAVKDRVQMVQQNNLGRFSKLERRRIRHLLLTTVDPKTQKRLPDVELEGKRRKIEQLLSIAKMGEDFVKLIELYSEEEGARENKGEATVVRRGRIPALEAAAYSLVPNQVSDVVETVLGFHIIRLEEIIPAERDTLEVARPRIEKILREQHLQAKMNDYLAKVKGEGNVKILSDKFKMTIPENAAPLSPSELVVPKGPTTPTP